MENLGSGEKGTTKPSPLIKKKSKDPMILRHLMSMNYEVKSNFEKNKIKYRCAM